MLISIIVGVTNVIPFFGPYIGAIPSALLLLVIDPMQCLYFIIFILVLQQLDGNIIGPMILGDATGLDLSLIHLCAAGQHRQRLGQHHLHPLLCLRGAADLPGHHRGVCGKNLYGDQGAAQIYYQRTDMGGLKNAPAGNLLSVNIDPAFLALISSQL